MNCCVDACTTLVDDEDCRELPIALYLLIV